MRDEGPAADQAEIAPPIGEIRYDPVDDRVQCHLCGKWFRFIGGTHLTRTHEWTLTEYRDAFRLPSSMATCSPGLSAIRRAQTLRRIADGDLRATASLADEAIRARANANRRLPPWRSLAAVHPELARELHPSRNDRLDPRLIAARSHRKVWWRCAAGHEWQATLADRSAGRGCPACANTRHGQRLGERNRRVSPDRTLAAKHPALFAELHPTRNIGLELDTLAAVSARAVWWRCGHGHEWRARVDSRSAGSGCPTCATKRRAAARREHPPRILPERSLAARRPELLADLHPTHNGQLDPETVSAGSTRRVWWRCQRGHEWQARVTDRARGSGCPVCARTRPAAPDRSLAGKHPQLAAELHPTRSSGVDPFALAAGSNQALWWRCRLGHEWKTTVAARVRGTGCPVCVRRRVPAERSLASKHPELIGELHPTRNHTLDPSNLGAFSNRKVWWQCAFGHQWQSRVASRSAGAGCPTCRGVARAVPYDADLAQPVPLDP